MSVKKYDLLIQKELFADAIQYSTFFHTRKNTKMFNINSKYFSFFNSKPPASWVVHITRDFFTLFLFVLQFHGATFILRFQVTISRLFMMVFGHLITASSTRDNRETILRCVSNILLKMYQYRCLQGTFKKSDQRIWRKLLDVLRMS